MDSELFKKFSGLTVMGVIASGIQLLRDVILAAGDEPQRWMFAFEPLFRYTENLEYTSNFGEENGVYPPHSLIDLSRFKGFSGVCNKCYLRGTDFSGKDIYKDRNTKGRIVTAVRFRPTAAQICSHYHKCPHFKRALEISDMSQFSEAEKKQLDFYLNSRWEIVVLLDILISLIQMSMEIDVDNYYKKSIYEAVEIAIEAGVDRETMLRYEAQYINDGYNEDVFGSPINCRKYIISKERNEFV